MSFLDTLFPQQGAQGTQAPQGAQPPGGISQMLLSALANAGQAAPAPPAAPPSHGILSRLMGGVNKFSNDLLEPTNGLSKLGAYLGAASGTDLGQAQLAAMKDTREHQTDALTQQQAQAKLLLDIRKATKPQTATVGHTFGVYDDSGQFTPTFTPPSDAEGYATSLGYQPGTKDYNNSMRDFVLRSNGPTAWDNRSDFEDQRQDDRVKLEGVRQGNRVTLRGQPTYSDQHPRARQASVPGGVPGGAPRTTSNVYAPILAKVSRGEALSPGEQQVFALYGRRGGKGGGVPGGLPSLPAQGAAQTAPQAGGVRRLFRVES